MSDQKSLHAIVRGRVQGVYFRAFVQQKANELGLKGFTRNLPSGNEVEVQAEGETAALTKLGEALKAGPPGANVEDLTIVWGKYCDCYSVFEIRY